MAQKLKIYRGDTFQGTINLRVTDPVDATRENPYPIAVGSTIQIKFPGTPSVVLSTANVGEVTVVDAALSTISFSGAPAKSLLMDLGTNQTLTLVHTDPTGKVTTFERTKSLDVVDRANE